MKTCMPISKDNRERNRPWGGAKEKTMAFQETLKNYTSRLSGFLGLQRNAVGVLSMVVLVGMGEHMAERNHRHRGVRGFRPRHAGARKWQGGPKWLIKKKISG